MHDREELPTLRSIAEAQTAAVAGAVAAALVAGPAAVIVGPSLSAAVESIFGRLRTSQARRLESSIVAASDVMKELDRLKYEIRDGEFFRDRGISGSDFEEIAESAFRAVTEDDEAKKAPVYGKLLARAVYVRPAASRFESLQRSDVIALIKLAKGLSYRQLCILGLIGIAENRDDGMNFRMYVARNIKSHDYSVTMAAAYEEFRDLDKRDLIKVSYGRGDNLPTIATLVGLAVLLYEQMELSQLPSADLEEVKAQLKAKP